MKILFIGDIFGSSGRSIIKQHLKTIISKYSIDLVIANAENSAHGKGLTPRIYDQLQEFGIDIFTLGNHTWSKKEVLVVLKENNVIRPLNLKREFLYSQEGVGSREFEFMNLKIRVTNLLGNSVNFKNMQDNCFVIMEKLLLEIEKPDIHIVDLHTETTAEKYAFLWAFNGRVDAILGTHTHVSTNDSCITDLNTAFICDVGMTGPSQGIIGGKRESIINKFYNPESKFVLETQPGPKQFSSVILTYDQINKHIVSVDPLIIREGFKYLGVSKINE